MYLRLTTAALLLIPLFVVAQLLRNYFTPGLGKIPGPFLARFSDLWRFIDACRGHRDETVLRLHKKHGKVVRLGPNCVSIADPAALEMVLGLRANLDKSDHVKPMENPVEGEVLPMLIAAKDSKLHGTRRRPIANAFSMSSILSYEDIVDQNINKMVRRLREEFVETGRACSIDKWLHWFTFDLIGHATFSQDFGLLDAGHDIDNMMSTVDLQFLYIGTVGFMPWIDYLLLKNPLLLALVDTPNHLVTLANEKIKKRKSGEEKQDSTKPDFLTRFLDAQKQHPDLVSDLQVKAYASTNVLAASDTTGSALTAIVLHIIKHPEVLKKLLKEFDDNSMMYPVEYSKAQSLPYLDAVIKETLRYCPTVAVELERVVGPQGMTLPTGQTLKPGTIVGINAFPIHRDTEVYGDDADVFRPERWLQGSDETVEHYNERNKAMQRSSIVFGYGPRACIGKHMAMLELCKLIPTLFGLFEMSLADPDAPIKSHALLSKKISDLNVILQERKLPESEPVAG